MSKAKAIWIGCLLLFSTKGISQEITIKNERLRPLIGATLLVLPDSTVLVSDNEGKVKIDPTKEWQVVVSHIGYLTQMLTINGASQKTIILSPSNQHLGEMVVEGFQRSTPLHEQAGSVSKILPADLKRFNETSLVNAVNTLPGVRFEERASASYRVSIRGSSIRSPFGVRNVKVYWNGVPFTEPGGNTFLNLLDLNNTAQLEIIKGPAGSIYGAGNGGVIKIQSTDLSTLNNASKLDISTGSFGLFRIAGAHNFSGENTSLTLKWASQESDGYREHNAMDRKMIALDGLFFPDKKRTISMSLLYSDLFYEIPGGLNPEQKAENPRQSRPGSIERNSSVANEFLLLKAGQEYQFNKSWSNETSLSLSNSNFQNPFILDFKKDNQQVFSLRTVFEQQMSLGGRNAQWIYGAEYQKSFFDGKNFGNVNGNADTIRFADNVESMQSILFANFNYNVGKGLKLTGGISRNALVYDITRTIDRINNAPQSFEKSFDAVWAPRVAVSKLFNDGFSVHFSVMRGFSPPTTTEVRTNEGSLNRLLQAEKGTNYELNVRGTAFQKKLSIDLALFHFRLSDAITSFTNSDGVVLFRNAGETRQNGIELSSRMNWLENGSGFVKQFNSSLAYTHHAFDFADYVTGGDDFTGNALPGTSPHVVNVQSNIVLKNGVYINTTYHYSDPIPLNDENTFFSDPYNLVNLRIGYKSYFGTTELEVFGGIDNLLNVSYSLGNDLNAFGRRYFQPSATANYYFGLKLKLDHRNASK